MGITISGHKLHITIPLPYKYRGGGVAVFRINKGSPEVLLGLRAINPGKGLWTFPGGGAEGRENLTAAAVREETGVQLLGRYITKTGVFSIRNFFFEWNTFIIESTQTMFTGNAFKKDDRERILAGGEFVSLQWVPLSEIGRYKLHRWVAEVVDFYLSGKMKPYKATPPKRKACASRQSKQAGATSSPRKETGESLLFDMAEMVLTKVGRDGTRYFRPAYQVKDGYSKIQEAKYGV